MSNLLRSLCLLLPCATVSVALQGQNLELGNCEAFIYEETDNSDSDSDGNICEFMVTATQTASYINGAQCDQPDIHWFIQVDVNNDGVIDYEFNSQLPETDDQFDDSDGNGIPDIYTLPTISAEEKVINLQDIEGPQSSHNIIWQVMDDCSAESTCVQNFEVLDTKPPTPFCISLATYVFDGFDLEIYAEDLQIGVFDNCTDNENLRYSFSGDSIVPTREITCDDVINSPVWINMYSWDEQGNTDFCVIYVSVIPDETVDCYYEMTDVHGYVNDPGGNPVSSATVTINAALTEFPRSTITDENGFYSFDNILLGPNYELKVEKDDAYLSEVTTLDLVIIMRHMLGLQGLPTPYHEFAADVNNDGNLKVNDLIQLRKLILGVISEFPNVTPWRFIDSSYDFDNPMDLPDWPTNNRENIIVTSDSYPPYNFVGVKMGNVTY